MNLLPLETRVRSSIEPDVEGTIVGYGVIGNEVKYLVLLDHGVWTESGRSYISVLVWDPSNVA